MWYYYHPPQIVFFLRHNNQGCGWGGVIKQAFKLHIASWRSKGILFKLSPIQGKKILVMPATLYRVFCTFVALGCRQACFIKSSEAKWVLLMTRSSEGPISSSSTRGTWVPDFFNRILQTKDQQHYIRFILPRCQGSLTCKF